MQALYIGVEGVFLSKKKAMGTILIATDFSEASGNATQYGVQLANALNAKVNLVSAYKQVPIPISDSVVIDTPESMRVLVQHQLESVAAFLSGEAKVPIGTICEEGLASSAILAAAKKTNADYILIGMKTAGKGIRKVFGNTITKLIRKTAIPLIVVPEEAKYTMPQAIALACDIMPDANIHLLDTFRILVERFHAKLHIVRVIKDDNRESSQVRVLPINLEKSMKGLDTLYEYPADKNVSHALAEFTSIHRIDMLAMMPHKHMLLERLLLKSNTQSMIFETHIPLLILPDLRNRLFHI